VIFSFLTAVETFYASLRLTGQMSRLWSRPKIQNVFISGCT